MEFSLWAWKAQVLTEGKYEKGFFYQNSLTIVFFILFLLSLIGQFLSGWKEYNNELKDDKYPPVTISEYTTSGHFISSTFANRESEFLQMALFVILTGTLRQKGSSESRNLDEKEEVDREPDPKKRMLQGLCVKVELSLLFITTLYQQCCCFYTWSLSGCIYTGA